MEPTARLPRLAFAERESCRLGAEVQRLSRGHVVRSMSAHAHDFYELLLFEESGGVHWVDGVEHAVSAGSLFFLQPGESHDCRALRSATGWLVLLARPLVRSLSLPDANRVPGPLGRRERARWLTRIEALHEELAAPRAGHEQAQRAHVTLLLVDLLRGDEAPSPRALSTSHDLVAETLAVVDARFAEALTLGEVARAVGRSPAHLTTLLRSRTDAPWATGSSSGAWRPRGRSLRATDATLDEVAAACGYTETSAFSRRFHLEHGISPGAWRASQRRAGAR